MGLVTPLQSAECPVECTERGGFRRKQKPTEHYGALRVRLELRGAYWSLILGFGPSLELDGQLFAYGSTAGRQACRVGARWECGVSIGV